MNKLLYNPHSEMFNSNIILKEESKNYSKMAKWFLLSWFFSRHFFLLRKTFLFQNTKKVLVGKNQPKACK
jgi:hypothetical protein